MSPPPTPLLVNVYNRVLIGQGSTIELEAERTCPAVVEFQGLQNCEWPTGIPEGPDVPVDRGLVHLWSKMTMTLYLYNEWAFSSPDFAAVLAYAPGSGDIHVRCC